MIQNNNEKTRFLKLYIITISIVCMMFLTACGGQSNIDAVASLLKNNSISTNGLIGTWVSPDAHNQVMEIRTEEIRFNYRKFDYSVDGNVLHLYQTWPNAGGVAGDMPFEMDGDTLTIQLGNDFGGYFYGRNGIVKLVRR